MRPVPTIIVSALAGATVLGLGAKWAFSSDQDTAARMTVASSNVSQQEWGLELLNRAFDVNRGDRLVVALADADVVLSTGSGSVLEVSIQIDSEDASWARESFDEMDFEVEYSGGVVRVRSEHDNGSRGNWRGHHQGANIVVVITHPADIEVEVSTGDGDIIADELNGRTSLRSGDGDIQVTSLSADASIATGDGDIHIEELAGDVSLASGDGDIWVESITGSGTRIATGDGDVSLSDVRSEIQVATGDGDIEVHISELHEVKIHSGDGDITVYAPSDAGADLRIEAEDLDLASVFRVVGRIRNNRIEGTMNGGGPLLELRTNDGTVRLRSER